MVFPKNQQNSEKVCEKAMELGTLKVVVKKFHLSVLNLLILNQLAGYSAGVRKNHQAARPAAVRPRAGRGVSVPARHSGNPLSGNALTPSRYKVQPCSRQS